VSDNHHKDLSHRGGENKICFVFLFFVFFYKCGKEEETK